MKYLLDTAVFLWTAFGERDFLSAQALKVFETEAILVISTVSVWEICIKYQLGKLSNLKDPELWLRDSIEKMGLEILNLENRHSLALLKLPKIHKDPFDRILLAQAKVENLIFLSPDKILNQYPVKIQW